VSVKRLFDILFCIVGLLLFLIPLILISIVIKLTSKGPALFWSDRVGRNSVIFKMPKFRTMYLGSPNVATHLLKDSNKLITPVGSFLRKTSLDELPQLWSILKGQMSVVGPRPALFNQYDLIELRKEKGVDQLSPGLTGWAQINGRDEIPNIEKVELDLYYLENNSFLFDLKVVFLTFFKVMKRDGVVH
jgi:O-antigen biosynthesis protein WbqP